MAEQKYILSGFEFHTPAEYHEALREVESIEFIKGKTDLNNMKTVLKLYNSLLDKESFHTVIGLVFLIGLRNNLIRSKIVASDELRSIPVKGKDKNKITTADELVKDKVIQDNNQLKNSLEVLRHKVKNLSIVIAFLIVTIIGLFVIAFTNDNSVISNYENTIIDRYSAWEEELNVREQAIIEMEEEAGVNK